MGIRENLDAIRRRVADAARRAARSPEDVTLVAVSKFQPDAAIVEAYQAGQRLFGENYAQELRDKAQRLGHLPDIDFHFIGRLQRNKAKYAVAAASCVQSLDDLALAEELNRRASSLTKQMGVLVEINFDEAQKGGVSLAELPGFLRALEPLAALRIDGLMAIPPAELSEDESRQVFRALAKAARQHRLKHLSMGMSGDFEIAIEEGATIVRVGTAIFGPRGIT